jgi:hypothetical protein
MGVALWCQPSRFVARLPIQRRVSHPLLPQRRARCLCRTKRVIHYGPGAHLGWLAGLVTVPTRRPSLP